MTLNEIKTRRHGVIWSSPNRMRVYVACLKPSPLVTTRLLDPFTTNPCRSFLEYACALCGIAAWQRTFSKKR